MHTWKNDVQTSANFLDFRSWILALRPKTLSASICPILLGTVLAITHASIQILAILSCFFCALCFQIASNFTNDAADFLRGVDTKKRIGPPRAALEGLLSPKQLYIGSAIVLTLSLIPGLYLVYLGGIPILILGILSILAAIAYTLGPIPFAYYALGDLFVFLFFGLIAVTGTYYVQTQASPNTFVIILSIITGLQASSIMAVNNTRDIETDMENNKITVSSLIKRKASNYYYTSLIYLSYILSFLLFFMNKEILYLSIFIPAFYYAQKNINKFYCANSGKEFNTLIKHSALHQLFFSISFSIGILL